MRTTTRRLAWLLLLPAFVLTGGTSQRPEPLTTDGPFRPFPGCEITRKTLTQPRPNVVYVVRLDPSLVTFAATPDNGEAPLETTLQTTRAFLEASDLDLAFNGSFYRAGRVSAFADLCGAAVAGGKVISSPEPGFHAVEIDQDNRLKLLGPNFGLEGRNVVVAGNLVLVENGRNRLKVDPKDPVHPRTALGATADGTLLVVLVDGRQAGVSEGLTQMELAELLVQEGATLAINLDGGGSATLVAREAKKGRVLNVPVGLLNQRGTERPVGFNIGVRSRAASSRPAGS
jgi:exopolysaccharide biosynthesis protein